MSALLAALISGTTTGLAVHLFHKVRLDTLGNDLGDYRAARHAPAVTPPAETDGGIVPARDVYRDAYRTRRQLRGAYREIARLRQVTYDLYERLNGKPRPRHTTLPAPSVHRLGWRDRARWFTPWPQAAITQRGQA